MSDGRSWSRITIVTPSFNQGKFLEETIRSILLQGYPNLEYFLLDGGSTDNSIEIIKAYSPWLTYWVSQHDGGQSDAINRGLRMGSGSHATWINSDDLLCRNALAHHATKIGFDKNTVYVGICRIIDPQDRMRSFYSAGIQSLEELLQVPAWHTGRYIAQPAVLFPRELALGVGGLNPDNHRTMDYELWGRFFLAAAKFHYTDIPFGIFRQHPGQKTFDMLTATESLVATAATLVKAAPHLTEKQKQQMLDEFREYHDRYKQDQWLCSGRLARLGLPRSVVIPVRILRGKIEKLFLRGT